MWMSMTCSIRPGRGDITTTRSASSTASSIECVMNSTVLRVASQSASRSSRICSRVSASSAPNGSSISSSGASWISARDDRDALPHAARQLVRVAVGEVREADLRQEPQRAVAVRARVEAAQLDLHEHVVERRAPVEQHRALEHDAEVGLRPVDDAARRRAPRPCVGRCRPATMRSSVLLPQPDGPTIARNSPSRIARSIALERVRLAPVRAGTSCRHRRSRRTGAASAARRRLAAADRPWTTRSVMRRVRASARRHCGTNSFVWNVVQPLSVWRSR